MYLRVDLVQLGYYEYAQGYPEYSWGCVLADGRHMYLRVDLVQLIERRQHDLRVETKQNSSAGRMKLN